MNPEVLQQLPKWLKDLVIWIIGVTLVRLRGLRPTSWPLHPPHAPRDRDSQRRAPPCRPRVESATLSRIGIATPFRPSRIYDPAVRPLQRRLLELADRPPFESGKEGPAGQAAHGVPGAAPQLLELFAGNGSSNGWAAAKRAMSTWLGVCPVLSSISSRCIATIS